MTEEGKKRLSTICIFAAIVPLLASIYAMTFVGPEPKWSHLAFTMGLFLSMIGMVLGIRKKRAN
jgi:Mg2+ and Co2+ transporter CorA